MSVSGRLEASVRIKNTGNAEGAQLIQLYIRDVAASRVRPVKELKGFKRVYLTPGEEREITFEIKKRCCGLCGLTEVLEAEPGNSGYGLQTAA